MGYTKQVWTDRDVQYPSRYTLTNVSGDTYDLARAEGTINAAGTLFNATKMNNIETGIKNVDNVTRYITATATTNGDYKVNITNTLETGMIIYISFPAATTNTAVARLSIDNGSNYKNIIDTAATNVIAYLVENRTMALYYNGTSFIASSVPALLYNANGSGITKNGVATLNASIYKYKCVILVLGFSAAKINPEMEVMVGTSMTGQPGLYGAWFYANTDASTQSVSFRSTLNAAGTKITLGDMLSMKHMSNGAHSTAGTGVYLHRVYGIN